MITLSRQHRVQGSYYETGTEFLGRIPNGWSMTRLDRLFSQKRETSSNEEELLSVYRDFGVIIKSSRDDNFNKPSEDLSNYILVQTGDLVINKMKAWQGSLGISQYRGIVSPAYFTYQIKKVFEKKVYLPYLHHLLRSTPYIATYRRISNGIRPQQWDLDPYQFRMLPIILPAIQEQKCIASYLDSKCALIDTLIAKKQRQIELLQEQRAAIIHKAVTKGLDENAEMKESGVEWAGKIPKGWEIKKLKTAFRFEKGKQSGMFTKEYVNDPMHTGEYPVYSGQTEDDGVMGKINSYIYSLDDTIFTTTVGAKVMTPMIIGGKFSLSQNCVLFIMQNRNIDVRYFFYQLFPMFKWEKDSIPSHMQPSLRVSDLNKYSVAVPSYNEQARIANFIEEKINFIDGCSKEIKHSISLLNEYKTSLISHAVTGKIKVSNESQ